MDSLAFLKDWAITYLKHMDIQGNFSKISEEPNGFLIINKDGSSSFCLVLISLSKNKEAIGKATYVVTLSNKSNISFASLAWDSLAANPKLVLVFANPFSSTEQKWLVKPYIHARVSERKHLLKGLKAMSELVEPIEEAAFAAKATSI